MPAKETSTTGAFVRGAAGLATTELPWLSNFAPLAEARCRTYEEVGSYFFVLPKTIPAAATTALENSCQSQWNQANINGPILNK